MVRAVGRKVPKVGSFIGPGFSSASTPTSTPTLAGLSQPQLSRIVSTVKASVRKIYADLPKMPMEGSASVRAGHADAAKRPVQSISGLTGQIPPQLQAARPGCSTSPLAAASRGALLGEMFAAID